MSVKEVIAKRRAYRSLAPTPINLDLITDLAACAALSASCFNNQPWRFIFITEKTALQELFAVLPSANEWAKAASMVIAVFSQAELDCQLKEREYFLFDTGMATALMILRATELELVAHPIAGYDEAKAKDCLGIPAAMRLITLIMVGAKAEALNPSLSENQIKGEQQRPERLPPEKFVYLNNFKTPFGLS